MHHFDADIISLCETHLPGTQGINIDNYQCFIHNRQQRHTNLNRTFGGVQVLVKLDLLNTYDVSILDKSCDGILCLKFIEKVTNYSFVLISCYLPPSNSIWGRDGDTFYRHLLTLIYLYTNVDAVLILGDFNSRIADECEVIEYVDSNIPI